MAQVTYQLNIVTPERAVFEGDVSSTTLPGQEGYLGVWANHAPMVAALDPGMLTIHEGSSDDPTGHYAIGGGFAQVAENKMILVVDSAELETDIDAARAEQSLERAKERLRAALEDKDVDIERAEAAKTRAEARLRVAYLRGK